MQLNHKEHEEILRKKKLKKLPPHPNPLPPGEWDENYKYLNFIAYIDLPVLGNLYFD